jgi:hypothetical protein
MDIKEVQISLNYFKQGDDLARHLDGDKHPAEAFGAHGEQMGEVAKQLAAIAEVLKKFPKSDIHVNADTHYIGITASAELIETLIQNGLASPEDEW